MSTVRRRHVAGALVVLLFLLGCASEMKPQELAAEYYNLGNGFFELRKYDKAIRYYEMALERNPDLASARWNLALSHLRTGSYDVAEESLHEWIARDPGAVEAREALALTYRGQGRREDALAVLDEVLEIAPEDTTALNNKAIILWELEKRPEAVEVFRRYLGYEPYNTEVLFNLMELYREQGMDEKALEYSESYLSVAEASDKRKPEDIVAASLVAARLYARAEVYYRALEVYSRVIEIDERQKDAWFEQAEILLTSVEDPARGVESLTKALAAGFADRQRIALLVAREDLLDRDRVEGVIRERDLLPTVSEMESARRIAVTARAPSVVEPRGPFAEPPGLDSRGSAPRDGALEY